MNTLITLITLIKLMKITQLLAAAGAPTCSIKNSTNCFHDDIPDYKFIIVNRTEQCCDACSSTPDCAAWTVDRSNYSPGLEEGGDCYLNTACTTLGPFNYGESGVMDEATWPETPFPPSWWNLSPLPKTKVGKKKVFEKLAPFLVTSKYGVPEFLGRPFMTSAGICTSPIPDGTVS